MDNSETGSKSKISIVLYLPGRISLKIQTSGKAKIHSLRKALPKDQNYDLIFEGTVLSDSLTLCSYNITNCSVITAVKSGISMKERNNLFGQQNSRAEFIHEKLKMALDSRQKVELLRLNDLEMLHREVQTKKYRTFIRHFELLQQKQNCRPPMKQMSKFYYKRPKKPSTKPLPIFWITRPYKEQICHKENVEQVKRQQTRSVDIVI